MSAPSDEHYQGALLVPGKLRPLVRSKRAIPRRALVERLHAKRNVPIVLIAAPPGYGKTTMVAELVSTDRRRSAWYSVDELDGEPLVFMSHLIEAVRELGGDPDRYLSSSVAPSAFELSPAAVLSFAALAQPVVLVIDNVQHLAEPISQETLLGLCEAVPAGSQLILITRSCTYDWLGRVDRKRLLIVNESDLRLSDREAEAFLAQSRIGLSPAQAEELNRRCEGWIAGLSLMVAVMGDEGGHWPMGRGLGADRFLKEYFEVEVLDEMEESDVDFLMRAALLRRLEPGLCNAALGIKGSRARLEALARRGAFLSRIDGEDGVFALHPLFSEMLDIELRERDPEESRAVLRRAAAWHEKRGELEIAIECAIRGDDLNHAAHLAISVGILAFRSGQIEAVERWLAAVDHPDLLDGFPALAGIGASMLALVGRSDPAERWLRHMLAADPNAPMPDGSTAATWAAGLRAAFCLDGVKQMRSDSEYARATVPPESSFAPGIFMAAAVAEHLSGERELAKASFQQTVEAANAQGSAFAGSVARSWLALIALKDGDVGAAEGYAQGAVEAVEVAGVSRYASSGIAYAVSARVALESGRRNGAAALADQADRLVSNLTHALPWLSVAARIEIARVRLAFSEPGQAHALLREIDETLEEQPELGELLREVTALRRELEIGRAPEVGWESALTPAELRLLPLLAGHHSFREIAEQLGISRNTVKTQAIAVYRKLEVSSRGGAVERAGELGLIAPAHVELSPGR